MKTKRVISALCGVAMLLTGFGLTSTTAVADGETSDQPTTSQSAGGGDKQQKSSGEEGTTAGSGDSSTQDTPKPGITSSSSGSQAAPDVTIHDMLDTDSASVSKLKFTGWVTGTAPFDKDNERGDDKDDNNAIVRSYDTVTYNYDYTLTPDDAMTYYRKARIGFRFELPYPADKVTFATDQMNWVDQTPGYTAKVTQEGDRQVFTAYRLLTPTSNSPTVCPGTSSISLAVKVLGAPNGYKFHPIVKAWTVPNDTSNRIVSDTPKDVTVSAKFNLNIRMVNYGIKDKGVFDFSSGAENAPNKGEGKVTGLGLGIGLVTEMRWPDRTKGLKGLEAPSGRITYKIHLSNQYSDDTKIGTKHQMERRWQPLFYDYGHSDNENSRYGRTFAWMGDLGYQAPNVADHPDRYLNVARGNTTITSTTSDQGTDVTISFDGYDTSVFPRGSAINDRVFKCSTNYMTSDCSTMQVGAIHSDILQFITPTNRDGKTVAQYYGNVDQTANINMDDIKLMATGVNGDPLDMVEDNSNQAVTTDDHAGMSATVRSSGWYSTRIRYTEWANWGWADAGTSGHWRNPDFGNGSDSLVQGSKVRLQIGHDITINSEGDAEVMGMGLVKFDPKTIEPVDDTPDSQPTIQMCLWTWGARVTKRGNVVPYWYAVKKDGTGWKDYKEQRDTKISGLDYYPTLNEAKRHGAVVGMLFEDHNTVDPDNTTFSRSFTVSGALPAHILDNARIGTVTPIVAESAYWTREALTKVANLNVDASDTKWQQWSDNITTRLPEYANSVKPNLTCSGDTYRPAIFDENGVYQGGDTADTIKGDSLYVAGETPHIAKQVAQTNEAGNVKTVYDIDKEQRTVDWRLTATADTSTTTDGGKYTTDYIITDTLPKGLSYVDGSMTVGGQYTQHTPDKGTVTGGTPITPTIVANKDGTTTMTIRVNGARADSATQTVITYSTTIGDASDPEHDVKNNDSFTNHVSIQSKRNMAAPLSEKAQVADATIRISRTHSTALATRANPLLNNIHSKLGFTNMLGNFSKDEKKNPYAVDIMPHMQSGTESKYHGSYTLNTLTVSGKNGASLDNASVWFTTDVKYRSMNVLKITPAMFTTWTHATFDTKTGTVTIPNGMSQPVAWAFTSDKLPANSRYDFKLTFTPSGNKAADAYVNRWTDGDNKVDAVTQVVERRVSGVAWFDVNHDGVRQDFDRILANVTVTLVDSNGVTVTGVDGKPCTTTTDQNGYYEIGSIPAGSGFKLRFTPKAGITWRGRHTTVKNAKEASEATDSDSDEEDDAVGNMTAGVIQLKDFPALDKMTSAVYEDPNEDHGLYGKLTIQSADIPVRKTLEGKDIDNWQHGSDYDDTYTVEAKPVGDAPKEGIKTPITLSDDKSHNLEVNGEAFQHEGDYQYEITEKKGSLKGVTYDPQVYEVTLHVVDNLDTLTRTITSTSSPKGANEQNTETVLHNAYAPAPTKLHMSAKKVLENSPHALQAGEFSFGLYEADTHNRLQTKTNDANGEVVFDDIAYDKVGLYSYYIQEDNGSEPGITYDTAAKSAVVNVVDDHKGSLQVSVLYNGKSDEPVITNRYSTKKVSATIQAHKNLTGRDLKAGEFTFQLFNSDNKVVSEASNDAAGMVTFPAVIFNKVGTYTYTVKEKAGGLPNITYDQGIKTVTITVTDDGQGNLVAHNSGVAEFNNVYIPNGLTTSFKATKKLVGKTLRDGQFQFELVDPSGNVVQTKSNQDEGRVLFDPVKFTAAGDYTYHIREKVPADTHGIQYDTSDHQVVAHVHSNAHTGELSVSTEYLTPGDSKDTGAVFTNSYSSQATWGIHGTKELTGRDMQAGEFKFYLKDAQGNKVAETTAGAGANGQAVAFQFPDVTKTTGDMDADAAQGIAYKTTTGYVYDYTVEEDQANLPSGVSARTASQTVEVVITDNNNGTMSVSQNMGTAQKPVAFVNDYSVGDAIVPIAGKKKLTSDSRDVNLAAIAGKFHFTITAANGAPLPVQTNITNQADGTVDFGQIVYSQGILNGSKQKTFSYQVKETGSVPGITNDTQSTKDFTITVKDNGKGALMATTDEALGDLFEFTNKYTSNGVEVPVNVTKTLTGKNLKKGEFSFQVKSADGTVLLKGTNGKDAASGEASTSEIGKLSFKHEGTYTYTVVEQNTGEQGITYDTSQYQFTVAVTNDGKGNLQASVHGQDGASGTAVHATFRNTYKPAPVTVGIHSTKTLIGRDMKAGEFSFMLKNAIGETVKTVTNTAAKDGQSSALDFGKLSYDYDKIADDVEMGLAVPDAQGGYIYGYSISEDKTNLPEGITAPSKIAFSVRVSDAGNGKLQAEVISDGKTVKQDNGIATVAGLINRYTEKNNPLTVTLKGIKTLSVDEGLTKPNITGKFHFTISGSNGAPMPSKKDVTNDANGNVSFGDVTFNSTDFKEGETKVFTYTVKETGTVPGVTNDAESAKTFTVKVARKNNTLAAVVADGADTDFTFVNKYTASPVKVEIGGDKTLTGRGQKAGEFSFKLQNDKGETVATTTTPAGAKDGEADDFRFPDQTFTKPGMYNYLVSEESGNKENKGGITYDTSVYKVQVKVTDNGKGALQAEVAYPDGQQGIHFKNVYKPAPETVAMDIAKTLNGRDMTSDEAFKIKVKDQDVTQGNAQAATNGATLKSTELLFQNLKNGDKGVAPDYVTFTQPGIYQYAISEESGHAVGVTYDKSMYYVKYVVTDDGNGHLVVQTLFGKDKDKLSEFKPSEGIQRPVAEFVNTYTPVKHNSIDVEKYDEKSGPQDGDRDDPKDALTVNGDTTIDIKVTNTGDETLTDLTLKDKTVEGSGTLGELKLPQTTLKPGESVVVSAQLTGITLGGSHRDTATVTGKTPEGDTVTDHDDWNGKRSIIPALPTEKLAQTGVGVTVLGAFTLAAAGLGFMLDKLRRSKASAGRHSK